MAIIGIDLGTTNSCVAVVNDGKPFIINDIGGKNTIPSIVSFSKSKESDAIEKSCGNSAYQQLIINAENTVYCVKRLIGHSYNSPVVKQLSATLSYSIVPNPNNEGIEIFIPAASKNYTPEEISSYILTELRAIAERHLGESVSKAVITVPAYFNNKQRQATRDAALIAGMDVVRIINEPTAAAIAYGYYQGANMDKLLAVFDFGGGTFDITIMEVSQGAFNVIATAGNTFLGGEDITNAIFEHFLSELSENYNLDEISDSLILQRLRDYAESAKKSLTVQQRVDVEIPYLREIAGNFIHFKSSLTREQLEELALPFVRKSLDTFRKTLAEVHLEPDNLDGIILIGGQTRMPLIQRELERLFPEAPILKNINPDETVAIGAAIQASLLDEDSTNGIQTDMLLLDVTPHNLGIAVGEDMFYTLIPKNSTVPTSVDDIFITSRDDQDRVKILLLQGDSSYASQNEILGEFELCDLRKAPRGDVKIKITYEIDINGIVTVEAVDTDTNKKQKITVASSSNLSAEDLNKDRGEQRLLS